MTIFVKNGGQYGGCWEWDTEVWREEVGMVTKGKHESICEIENVKCLACESDPWTRWWKCIALSTHMHTQVHMSTSKPAEIWIRLLECIMEKEMAPHSSVLAWRTPGTEEPGGLPSMGSHRVGPIISMSISFLWILRHVMQNILVNETWKSIQGIFLHYFLQLYVNL